MRPMATRTCPSCGLAMLNFTQKLNHLGQPIGGATAFCRICSRGYYLEGRMIRDISIRCARLGVVTPAHYCPRCPVSDACLKELMQHGA